MDHELFSTLTRIDKMYRRGIITGGQALNQQVEAVAQFTLRWGRLAAAVTDAGAIAAGELSVVHRDAPAADVEATRPDGQPKPAAPSESKTRDNIFFTAPFGAMRPRA